MKKENRKIEEIVVLVAVVLLFALSLMVFEKVIPSSFESITGKVLSTVNIVASVNADCNFTLSNGFNLVSFFCIGSLEARDDVIGSLSNIESIFEYEEGESDLWKTYNPNLPSFVIQDLEYVNRMEGYWINMNGGEDFFLAGALRRPTDINLVPSWNLAGYPTNETKGVNQSFSSISGNFTEARAYNVSSGSYISYVPGVGGALNQTEAYYGYWINATVNEVWFVD